MTTPGPVIVQRDMDALIDKAAVSDYRPAERSGSERAYARCFNCAERQSVPLYWCDHVGRQVDLDHTCKKFKGIHHEAR